MKPAGCYYSDANGQQKELEVGGTADVGNLRHNCEKVAEVEGRVKYHINGQFPPHIRFASPPIFIN
jgi:hypothetical protein